MYSDESLETVRANLAQHPACPFYVKFCFDSRIEIYVRRIIAKEMNPSPNKQKISIQIVSTCSCWTVRSYIVVLLLALYQMNAIKGNGVITWTVCLRDVQHVVLLCISKHSEMSSMKSSSCRTGWPIKKWIILYNRRVCDASGLRVISWPDDGNEKNKQTNVSHTCGEPVWLFGCIQSQRDSRFRSKERAPLAMTLFFFFFFF